MVILKLLSQGANVRTYDDCAVRFASSLSC